MPPAENKVPRTTEANQGPTARTARQTPLSGKGRDDDDNGNDDNGNGDGERDDDERDNGERGKPTFAEERMSNEDLAKRLRDVENQLAATRAGMPLSLIPEHGAGPGTDVNETWSQAEQEVLSVTVPDH